MNLSGFPSISSGQVHNDSADAKEALGTLAVDSRGRIYRYVQTALTLVPDQALIPGELVQAAYPIVAHGFRTLSAVAPRGARELSVALGGAPVVANYYADGLVYCDSGSASPAMGAQYAISSHPANAGSSNLRLTLRSDDVLQVDMGPSNSVTLVPHPCRWVLRSTAPTPGAAIGVAVYPIGAGRCGWIGCVGDFPLVINGTPPFGTPLCTGSIDGQAFANDGTKFTVGRLLVTATNGRPGLAAINLL